MCVYKLFYANESGKMGYLMIRENKKKEHMNFAIQYYKR